MNQHKSIFKKIAEVLSPITVYGTVIGYVCQFFVAVNNEESLIYYIVKNMLSNWDITLYFILTPLAIISWFYLRYNRRKEQREKIAKLEQDIQQSSAFEKFENSLESGNLKGVLADVEYLKICEKKRNDKLLTAEESEFYNEYIRVNN